MFRYSKFLLIIFSLLNVSLHAQYFNSNELIQTNVPAEFAEDDPDDIFWFSGNGTTEFGGDIETSIIFKGDLYVGGTFLSLNEQYGTMRGLVKWDGYDWSEVGGGTSLGGVYSGVYSLLKYEDLLVVGGSFGKVGDSTTSNIAMWDGEAWQPFPTGFASTVTALAEYDGTIIAGLKDGRVFYWDGAEWQGVGDNFGFNDQVNALHVFDGKLYAGGSFTESQYGGISYDHIAVWDGSSWSNLGDGCNGTVSDIVEYNSALYVSGYFTQANSKAISYIARWTGSDFEPLGFGVNDAVHDMYVLKDTLYVSGKFTEANANPVLKVAAWDGTTWHETVDNDFYNDDIYDLGEYDGHLLALSQSDLGEFSQLAYVDEGEWRGFGKGANNPVQCFVLYKGNLIVGGNFTSIGGRKANKMACWDGESWTPMDNGLREYTSMNFYALHVHEDTLFAGGRLIQCEDSLEITTTMLAYWDEKASRWKSKTGDNGSMSNYIYTLTTYQGNLVVGGGFGFIDSDNSPIHDLAQWDGRQWSEIDLGVTNAIIRTATEFLGNLVIGGYFTGVGGAYDYIASWDGENWSTLGDGLNSDVYALEVDGDQLLAGGYFTKTGSNPMFRIGAWDGSNWSGFANGIDYAVSDPDGATGIKDIMVMDDKMYVTGQFESAHLTVANHVAYWDRNNSEWNAMGSGLWRSSQQNGQVLAPFEYQGGTLVFVGGYFSKAGGKFSANYAIWGQEDPRAIPIQRENKTVNSYALSNNYPNPFNPSTTFEFTIPKSGMVEVNVYNILGMKVKTLENGWFKLGSYQTSWDGTNQYGNQAASGLYFYQLKSGGNQIMKKMMLVR